MVEQTQSRYSDDEVKRIELMQRKAVIGYRGVYDWLKEQIMNESAFKIEAIIEKSGIVDNDIKHQLLESHTMISFHHINLSS